MKKFNFETWNLMMPSGMQVILVHKPEFEQSFFLLGTDAGGLDLWVRDEDQCMRFPSGCAHYLEHQMFRLNGQDVTERFAQYSASTNAFTSLTETAYYFSTTFDPAGPLHLLMEFVQNLDIDAQSVEKEKGIILSEYEMYQQNPDARLMQMVWQALYVHHPIQIDVLGTPHDIEQMQVSDLKAFYDRYYDPSHLFLVGITGKDPHRLLNQIRQAQSQYASKKGKYQRYIPIEPLHVAHQRLIDHMELQIPYVSLAIKLLPLSDPLDCAILDMALQMSLDAWFTSLNPKYQSWIDQEILTSTAGCECEIMCDHAYLMFYAQTEKVDAFFSIVQETLTDMKIQKIDERVFNSLKNRSYAQSVRVFDHFESFAIELFQAQVQKVDYFKLMEQMALLDQTQVFEQVRALDFSHQSQIILDKIR